MCSFINIAFKKNKKFPISLIINTTPSKSLNKMIPDNANNLSIKQNIAGINCNIEIFSNNLIDISFDLIKRVDILSDGNIDNKI